MHLLKIVSVLILVAFAFPTCAKILRGSVRQNLTTWILWALLDGLTGLVVIFRDGNYWLPICYAATSLVTAGCVLYATGLESWRTMSPATKRRDTQIGALVVACLGVWMLAGSYFANIAGTTAVIVAGIPQLEDCWKKPQDNWTLRWFASATASALSAAAGSSWTVEERLFPVVVAIYCFLCAAFTARKYLPHAVKQA